MSVVMLFFQIACASQIKDVILPNSKWNNNFSYSYKIPNSKTPNSLKITIAIVHPNFPEVPVGSVFSKVFDGLADSLSTDFDSIIIAKGMTVTGPFEDLNMMTYPDKKNANLTLTPHVYLNSSIDLISGWEHRENGGLSQGFRLTVSGWIILEMREPLSNEKIWIKKIKLKDSYTELGQNIAEINLVRRSNSIFSSTYEVPGNIIYDGRKEAMAFIIKEFYPEIMKAFWDYINGEEITMLNQKANEIRKMKKY